MVVPFDELEEEQYLSRVECELKGRRDVDIDDSSMFVLGTLLLLNSIAVIDAEPI